jgi:long-chain acyl-CoA synthetase
MPETTKGPWPTERGMSFTSIPEHFLLQAELRPDETAYAVRAGDTWEKTDWRRGAELARTVAKGYMSLGLEPGETVGILGFNCPEWTISDVAAMCVGAVPVGIYTSSAAEQIAYILRHARAKIVVVQGGEALAKVLSQKSELPDLQQVVLMGPAGANHEFSEDIIRWDDLLARGSGVPDQNLEARIQGITSDNLAKIIYTSGTTGPPKGSMLTHGNLEAATRMGAELLPRPLTSDTRYLSYLPMAHAAELALTLLGPAMYGYTVYYAESIEGMAANLKEVEPDLFLGVPRVWEKIHSAMMERLGQATGTRARVARWARRVGLAYHSTLAAGHPVPRVLGLRYALASRLLFNRIRKAVGLSRATVLLSGAAPLARNVLEDLASLDLPIREVYGQTEASGPTSNNRPGETRWGSVGRPFHGVGLRIGEDGEILVSGEAVFEGYFHDAEATAEVLKDGWLHSGDLGYLDADGYLYVTGRKKEILITAGGKNISPKNIEEAIKVHSWVQEVVLIGDRRRFLSALVAVVPSVDREEAYSQIWDHVQNVNASLSSVESVKKIALLPEPLTVEAGELTPTLKLRRKAIAELHKDLIESIYA